MQTNAYTIALYPLTHVHPSFGRFNTARQSALQDWLSRIVVREDVWCSELRVFLGLEAEPRSSEVVSLGLVNESQSEELKWIGARAQQAGCGVPLETTTGHFKASSLVRLPNKERCRGAFGDDNGTLQGILAGAAAK